MPDLDAIDRTILEELDRNARLPVTKLAARVGLSRTAVQLRIDRMERDGIIQGYGLRTGEGIASGPKPTGAFIEVRLKERMKHGSIVAALRKVPEIQACHNVSGELDLILLLEQTDPGRVQEICQDLWAHPNVESTNTIFVLASPITHS